MVRQTALAFTALLWCREAGAQQITEFPIPSGPLLVSDYYVPGMTVGKDGGIWFAGASTIGRAATNGTITEYPGSASDLAWGPDGAIWFTSFTSEVFRLGLDGTTQRFPVPTTGSLAAGITTAPDGNLWYTEMYYPDSPGGFSVPCCAVGRISLSGAATDFPLPKQSDPRTILLGPDGRLWVQGGVFRASLDGTITAVPIAPPPSFSIDGMTLGSDGKVWFTSRHADLVGRIAASGAAVTFALPAGAQPLGITAGPDGNLWFTEFGRNRIGMITPAGEITEYDVPTHDSGPKGIVLGPDGDLWFLEAKAGKLGRLRLGGGSPTSTLVVPATAATHGLNGTYFRSDLWLTNQSSESAATLTLTYRCFSGQSCGSNTTTLTVGPRLSVQLVDVIGQRLAAPEAAGAIEITYPQGAGPVSVTARVYTDNPAGGTFGSLVPAVMTQTAARRSLFAGLGNNGNDLSRGYRTNAGAYNPNGTPAILTFSLFSRDGVLLGTYTRGYQAREAGQLSPNVFSLVGAGTVLATDAYLTVESTVPVFPYIIVIDNQTGDPTYVLPTNDD